MQPPVVGRSARHSDHPFYGKSQGAGFGRAIFLWWFSFFCAAEKPEKWGKLVKNKPEISDWTLG